MTFIDWTDTEGMFALLVDVVATERAEVNRDPERLWFLEDLLVRLQVLEADFPSLNDTVAIERLKNLRESLESEFDNDPAVVHLEDCIEELERVKKER